MTKNNLGWCLIKNTMLWLIVLLTLLHLPICAHSQIPLEKQIQILDVRLGFPAGSLDMYKEGKWVPVSVTLGPPREINSLPDTFTGTLEVSTKDSDGWNTHIFKEKVVVARDSNRLVFQSYIKVSDSTSFNGVQVRLRGKLGATDINQSYSYPSAERARTTNRSTVDHETLLVVNIGNSHGFRATEDPDEVAAAGSNRTAPKLMSIVGASPNKLFELPDRWYG